MNSRTIKKQTIVKLSLFLFQKIPLPANGGAVCVAASSQALWVLMSSGEVHIRQGLTETSLQGTKWRLLSLDQIGKLLFRSLDRGCVYFQPNSCVKFQLEWSLVIYPVAAMWSGLAIPTAAFIWLLFLRMQWQLLLWPQSGFRWTARSSRRLFL